MVGYTGATSGTSPGYTIAQVFRLLRRAMDDELRGLGLTTPQWAALACLRQMHGLSGAEMARIHHVTPQTMNTILQNLEQSGLIVRVPHPTNGTVLVILLTDEGRQRLEAATARVEAVHERMLSELDGSEKVLLMELLGRCVRGLTTGGPVDVAFCPE